MTWVTVRRYYGGVRTLIRGAWLDFAGGLGLCQSAMGGGETYGDWLSVEVTREGVAGGGAASGLIILIQLDTSTERRNPSE